MIAGLDLGRGSFSGLQAILLACRFVGSACP
jgi:hypothetical protein